MRRILLITKVNEIYSFKVNSMITDQKNPKGHLFCWIVFFRITGN